MLRLVFALIGVAGVVAAVRWGYDNPPDVLPPSGRDAEAAIAQTFGRPSGTDASIVGDYLIERFYGRDEEGKSFIVDMCKGRVRQVKSIVKPDGTGSYSFELDREGLSAREKSIEAHVRTRSDLDEGVTYRGLKVQDGPTEAFQLNYTGFLPEERSPFELTLFPDAFSFLEQQSFDDIDRGAKLINIRGTMYLLSSTANFPYFASKFGAKRSIFLSETFLIDPLP